MIIIINMIIGLCISTGLIGLAAIVYLTIIPRACIGYEMIDANEARIYHLISNVHSWNNNNNNDKISECPLMGESCQQLGGHLKIKFVFLECSKLH